MGSRYKREQSKQKLLPPPFRLFIMAAYAFALSSTLIIIFVSLHNVWPFASHAHGTGILDRLSVVFGVQEKVYAVVIDAGSTGSRVLAFTFFRSLTDNSLKLDDELWHEVKPGLSSYADDPKKGAESLVPLLKLAYERVPLTARPTTPLVLKATAGLRLLPPHKSEALIREVKNMLDQSDFLTTEDSVGIMDGRDEGIFSWFTANYLMDLIGGDVADTMVALDLGGGSTQVTFVPVDQRTVQSAAPEQLSSISLMNQNLQLFTHSYLGLGLMAGRKAVLLNTDQKYSPGSGDLLRTPCFNPTVETTWQYGGKDYRVGGPEKARYVEEKGMYGRLGEKRPVAEYEECLRKCTEVIKQQVQNVPDELQQRNVIAFSYFFDRATEQGLIDPFKGGIVTVNKLAQVAKQTCEVPNADQPFACLDLTFISAFLSSGYRLKSDTPVRLYKRIDGHELSWGLGLAFHIINNDLEDFMNMILGVPCSKYVIDIFSLHPLMRVIEGKGKDYYITGRANPISCAVGLR